MANPAPPATIQTAASPAGSPRELLILADQANSIQGNILALIGGNAITVLVAAWIMVDPAPRWAVLLWLGLQLTLAALSLAQALRIRRRPAKPHNAARRLRGNTIGIGINGLLWAAGVLLFWPSGRLDMQLLLSLVVMGSLTAVLHSVSAWRPAFYAFFFPCTASVVLASLWEGNPTNLAFALTTTIYGVTCTRFAARLNATLLESLRARYAIAELAADLRLQKERAEEADLAKSRFLAAASHDLRQPVHALSLFVGALRHEPPGPQAQYLLDRIDGTLGTLGSLFDALLDISKLDAGMLHAQQRPIDLRPLLERLCAQESLTAAGQGLALRTNLRTAWVHTDPVLLERMARNLLVNALRYTRQGGVLVSLRQRGPWVHLKVTDTGVGIAPAAQEMVFHEFVQLHNTERDRQQGLGLGLSIVRRLARLLGVEVQLRSRPDRGSTFALKLRALAHPAEPTAALQGLDTDVADLADSAAGSPVGALAGPATDAVTGPVTGLATGVTAGVTTGTTTTALASPATGPVLVVDDDSDIRTGMRSLLESWGFEVLDAASLAELLPQLQRLKAVPQLVITDYRLRDDQTGHQVINGLRDEFNVDLPALIVTGDTAAQRLRDAAAGGHVLLHKPVSAQQLQAAVLRATRPPAGPDIAA